MGESNAQDTVEVLLFSDDVNTRATIMDAVGTGLGADYPQINWVQVATADAVRAEYAEGRFAALVLDGESAKEGGVSVAHSLHGISSLVPPIVLLTARPQDEWMARWADTSQVVMAPFDALDVEKALQKVLS